MRAARHTISTRGIGLGVFVGTLACLAVAPAAWAMDATVQTVEAEGHASSGGLPQFDATWFPSQIFWLAIAFIVMYRFFARIILPRIADTITVRANKISADLRRAEELAESARKVRASYEREMAQARDKSTDAVREVDAKIKEKTADLMYAYRTKVTMETTRAMDDLNREKNRLVAHMHALAANVAAQAAEKILEMPVDVEQAARVVEQIDPSRRAA